MKYQDANNNAAMQLIECAGMKRFRDFSSTKNLDEQQNDKKSYNFLNNWVQQVGAS